MIIMDAIKNAFTSLSEKKEEKAPPEVKSTEETKTHEDTSATEGKGEEKGEEKKSPVTEDLEKDKRVKNALALLDSLENEQTAAATITFLVQAAAKRGLLESGTKEERKEVQQSIVALLKENTSEENHFMVEALGPALEKVIKAVQDGSEVRIKGLEKALKDAQAQQEVKEAEASFVKLLEKEKYEPYLDSMAELMDEFPPKEGSDPAKYIEKIYEFAVLKDGKKKTEKKKDEKIKENEKSEFPSSKSGSAEVVVVNAKPTLQEAIKAAREGKQLKVG